MFKEIFNRLAGLIFSPQETWEALSIREEDQESLLSKYVYPLIGLMALAAFVGVLFSHKEFDLQIALKSAIKTLVSTAGGFYLAGYLMNEVFSRVLQRPKDMRLSYSFVGYASGLMFALNIVLALLPSFFFLRFIVLYTAYIVWEGADVFLHVADDERLRFTTFASTIIIVAPFLIDFLVFLLMPGLRL